LSKHLDELKPEQMAAIGGPKKRVSSTKTARLSASCIGRQTGGRIPYAFAQKRVFLPNDDRLEMAGIHHSHLHQEPHPRGENGPLQKGEYPLVPTFRLPTLIHSRSGNAKWLYEISNRNPIWMHPSDAEIRRTNRRPAAREHGYRLFRG
jgi:anaerobic selenocysteine-containing dehydrogenase